MGGKDEISSPEMQGLARACPFAVKDGRVLSFRFSENSPGEKRSSSAIIAKIFYIREKQMSLYGLLDLEIFRP